MTAPTLSEAMLCRLALMSDVWERPNNGGDGKLLSRMEMLAVVEFKRVSEKYSTRLLYRITPAGRQALKETRA